MQMMMTPEKKKYRSKCWSTDPVDRFVLLLKKIIFRPRRLSRKQYEEEESREEDLELEYDDRWSKELPDDIMALIIRRLPTMSDYICCRHVCPSWRAAIDSNHRLPAVNDHVPWLLRDFSRIFYINTNDYNFVFHRNMKLIAALSRPWRCLGSIDGWLIMVVYGIICRDFFFLNPVSGDRVNLPPDFLSDFTNVEKAAASSAPKNNRNNNCYVACLHIRKIGRLAFCTPTDSSWIFIRRPDDQEGRHTQFGDIEIVGGKLYAVGSRRLQSPLESVTVFDIQINSDGRGRRHTYTAERLVTLHPELREVCCNIMPDGFLFRNFHLVKGSCNNSEDLFIILDEGFPYIEGFRVLKLVYNDIVHGHEWVEIVQLDDDQVLFVSGYNTKLISSHDETLQRNSIYFAYFNWNEKGNSGVFSLTHKRIKPLPFPKEHRHGRGFNFTIWFTPTFS